MALSSRVTSVHVINSPLLPEARDARRGRSLGRPSVRRRNRPGGRVAGPCCTSQLARKLAALQTPPRRRSSPIPSCFLRRGLRRCRNLHMHTQNPASAHAAFCASRSSVILKIGPVTRTFGWCGVRVPMAAANCSWPSFLPPARRNQPPALDRSMASLRRRVRCRGKSGEA